VAHDILGLRIGFAGLKQQFDGRHLLAALGLFQPVGEDDESAPAALDAGMELEHQARPEAGQIIGAQRGTVKEIEQAAIAPRA
jgi:hypothetical protein